MLHFVFGAKGAGKTPYLYRVLGEAVREDGALALLLVPRQSTFENDKGVLRALGAQNASKVQVLSFSRLADAVFKRCGKPLRPLLGAGANTALMVLALEATREQLQFFSRQAASFGFAQRMLAAVAQFKQSGVTPQSLRDAAGTLETGFLRSKLLETALIFETYDTIVENSFFDDQDVLTLVAEKLPESGLLTGKTVVINGFSAFCRASTTASISCHTVRKSPRGCL